MTDEAYMKKALELAGDSFEEGEVPVGAVIVWNDENGERIVGTGRNRREKAKNALCHAELEAINEACAALGGWRLHKATIYITLEPCPMCAGAIINSRIKRVVYAARDAKSGAFGSVFNINDMPLNHRCEVTHGVSEGKASELLSGFFEKLREKGGKAARTKNTDDR